MTNNKKSWLEQNPKKTLVIFILLITFGLLSAVEYVLSKKLYVENSANKRYLYIKEIIPNTKTIGPSDQPEKKFVQVRTDENGLLMPSRIHESPDMTLFFLGSSTMLTVTLEEAVRIPYNTGRLLESTLGKKVNSYNGAASSSSTIHGINVLVNKAIPYSPDYLVFMYNAMDLLDLRVSLDTYWKNNLKTVQGEGLIGVLKSIKNSWFPNIYYVLKSNLDFNIGAAIESVIGTNKKRNIVTKTYKNFDFEAAKDRYTKNLKAIISLCRVYGITPVILTEPYSVKDAHEDELLNKIGLEKFLLYQKRFNDIVRDLGSQNDVILVDLDKELTFEGNEKLFVEKFHFTKKGAEKVASIISTRIKEFDEKKHMASLMD